MTKRAEAVTVIGGADGPTSVFLVGRINEKKKWKDRIRTYFYKKKRSRVEKRITADFHTARETASYIKSRYHGVEVSDGKRWVREEREDFPLDFHAFEIPYPDGTVQIILEDVWGYLGVSRSGSKSMMRKSKKVVKDLYCYYGVTESDIRSRSRRYQALIAVLCE